MYDMGLRLKELRKKRKLSQASAAARLGLHKSTIAGYEGNVKTPSLEVLINMSLLYNAPTDYILGLNNKKTISAEGLSDTEIELLENFIHEIKKR